MFRYVGARLIRMVILLIIVSMLVFFLIQLPPGDILSARIQQMILDGTPMSESEIANLRALYSLDEPVYVQYWNWVTDIVLRGDFNRSFTYSKPVLSVIGDRVPTTIVLSLLTLIFTWIVAYPIGVISAVKQYSAFDYLFSFIGFLGVSIPSFLLALVAIFGIFKASGVVLVGLYSQRFLGAPMSLAKFADLLRHIWLPIVIIGLNGTASLIRTTRALMLDELRKPYITAARARGIPWKWVLIKYPMRVAITPMLSTFGWMLPNIISGESIVAVVLSLQTLGPIFLQSLLSQDMYLAGTILLFTSVLAMVGSLVSDILLAVFDPRIRFGGAAGE